MNPVADDNWDDLSEETLRNIAGGCKGGNRGNDSGKRGQRGNGGGNASPGDVTILSCFFGRR